jgi:hypothetical protein
MISGSLSLHHGASSEVGPCHHSMVHPQKWVPDTTAWCILRSGSLTPSLVHPQKWVPVTIAWRILRLRMEEWAPIWGVAVNELK